MLQWTRKHSRLLIACAMAGALIAAMAVAAPAGRRVSGPGMRERGALGVRQAQPVRMEAALGLTQDQKDRIHRIIQEHRQRAQEIRQSNAAPEQKRARMRQLRQDLERRVSRVLTPEQREKAKTFRAGWAQGFRAGGGMARVRMQRRIEQLKLSPDQRQRIAQIRQKGMEAVRDVRTNSELSDRAKQDRIRVIRERTHREVMSVLTPEQRQKANQMRPQLGQDRGKGPAGRGERRNSPTTNSR